MTSRFALLLSFSVILGMTHAQSVLAEQVPVRAEKSDNGALMTFAWREPVAYQHKIEDDRLNIRFSRPIEISSDSIIEKFGGLISDPRAGADGRSVSFKLHAPVKVFAFYTGTAVTVELVVDADQIAASVADPTPSAQTTTITQTRAFAPAQSAPDGAPAIGVRTGQHADYTRIVFDFTEATPYEFANENGVVTLRFSRLAQIDVARLNAGNVRLIGGARAAIVGDQTVVTLAVPSSSPVRGFETGTKIVVDVREPSGSADPVALPEAVAVAPAAAPEAPALAETAAATEQPATPPSDQAATTQQAPAAQPTQSVETAALSGEQPTDDGKPRALTPQSNGENASETSAPAETTAPTAPAAPAAAPETESNASGPEELSSRAQAEVTDGPLQTARASATPGEDRLAFRFDFDEPVAAAAFRRGGAVWIVFDKPMTVDTAALQVAAGEAAFEILQVPNNAGTVLRIRTSRRYNPEVKRDGLSWLFDLAPRPMAPQTALEVKSQPDSPVGARVFVATPEPGKPVGVSDPNIGDNFIVVPLVPLGQSIGRPFKFPQFNIQTGAQGVIINPLIDDLRVRSLRQGIEIGSGGVQLAITRVSDDAAAHAQLAASRAMVIALPDLDKFFVTTNEFRVARRRFEGIVAEASKREKAGARLELAKFFFANGYAAETLGVVRVAIQDVPLLEDDPSVRVLRGGSNFLMGRYEEALKDFTHESLLENDEGRLWAAATNAMIGDRIGAARDLRFTGSIARDYPRALKMPLGILIAEVAAETGDGQGAKLFLDALNLEDPTPNERAMLKFAEGKLKELDGDYDTSIGLWEDVIQSEHRPSRARARVARTELLLKLRRIEFREAIEEYEKLRFAWRGDRSEFSNLRRLGALYLDDGFYREGLTTLKQAATHFRDYPEAPEITKQMSDTFNALFLDDESEVLDPVKAIAIYNEFKELTPAGARGDEMIRNLADKLVKVDLLDRAAELLKAQVQFRLQGEEKARVGARLALIYMLAREYQKAFEVLEGTNVPALPEDIDLQRRYLRAQSLIGVGRNNDVLSMLEKDENQQAELLRTEIFWNSGNWLEASKSLRLLVKASGAKAGEPINDVQATRIINYAIALTNSGGERAVAQLRREFGAAMTGTKFAEAFDLVTTPPTIGLLDRTRVASKVQGAETFLSAYRDKLKDGVPLSSLN